MTVRPLAASLLATFVLTACGGGGSSDSSGPSGSSPADDGVRFVVSDPTDSRCTGLIRAATRLYGQPTNSEEVITSTLGGGLDIQLRGWEGVGVLMSFSYGDSVEGCQAEYDRLPEGVPVIEGAVPGTSLLDADPVEEPANDAPGTTDSAAPTPSPMTAAPVAPTPVAPTPEPAPEPVAQQPTPDLDGLEALFGRVRFDYAFTGVPGTTLSIDAAFGANSVQTGSNGSPILVDPLATFTLAADGEAPLTISGPIACSGVDGQTRLLCTAPLDGGAVQLFAFDPPSGGRSSGDFAFCSAGTTTTSCVQSLLVSPSGSVSVSVSPLAARLATAPAAGPDLVPYLAYAAQGVPSAQRLTPVDPGALDAMNSAARALLLAAPLY